MPLEDIQQRRRNAARTSKHAPARGRLRREDNRMPLPGTSARPHRVRAALHQIFQTLLKENRRSQRPRSQRELKVRAALTLQRLQNKFVGFADVVHRLAPSSFAPRTKMLVKPVELRAALAQPEMLWLRNYVIGGHGGRKARRGLLWAALVTCACTKQNKDLLDIWEHFRMPSDRDRWVFGDLRGPSYSTGLYDNVQSLCGRRDSRTAWHATIAMHRRIHALTDHRGKPLHPDHCRRVAVDGCLIEEDVPQRAPFNPHHRLAVNGRKRKRATFITYVDRTGRVRKAVAGYKWIVLTCMATGLPLNGGLFEATYDERRAVLELIAELRLIWPACPIEVVVGDMLYDRSKQFRRELYAMHGIELVAPTYPVFSEYSPWHETKGVPQCDHGEMKFHKHRFFYGTKWRAKHDQPLSGRLATGVVRNERGQIAQDNVYLVWLCPLKFENQREAIDGCCDDVITRWADDVRLYTLFPRGGDSPLAALRQALLCRRGVVESLWSTLKNLGLGGDAQRRMKWGGDIEKEWVFAISCAYLVARRLAHETGDYQRAYEQAVNLGLLPRPSRNGATQSPRPCVRAHGVGQGILLDENLRAIGDCHPPVDRDDRCISEEIPDLESWTAYTRRLEHEPDVEFDDDAPLLADKPTTATERRVQAARRWLYEGSNDETGESDLFFDLEVWAPDDEPAPGGDEEAVPPSARVGTPQHPHLDREDDRRERRDAEDVPLEAFDLDEDEYVAAYGDISVDDLMGAYAFDVGNDESAAREADDLGVDDDLTLPADDDGRPYLEAAA